MEFLRAYWQTSWCAAWSRGVTFEEMRAILVALEAVEKSAGLEAAEAVSDQFEELCTSILKKKEEQKHEILREESVSCAA